MLWYLVGGAVVVVVAVLLLVVRAPVTSLPGPPRVGGSRTWHVLTH